MSRPQIQSNTSENGDWKLEYSGYQMEAHRWVSIFSCPGLRCDSCGFPSRSEDENSPRSLFIALVRTRIRQSSVDRNRYFVRQLLFYVQSIPLSRTMALAAILGPNGPPHIGNYTRRSMPWIHWRGRMAP
jgi:hypothetical protein